MKNNLRENEMLALPEKTLKISIFVELKNSMHHLKVQSWNLSTVHSLRVSFIDEFDKICKVVITQHYKLLFFFDVSGRKDML